MPGSSRPSPRTRGASPCRGFALVLTLLLVTLLSILVIELSFTTKAEVRISENYSHDLQNHYALTAGLQFAKVILKDDFERNEGEPADHLHEVWSSAPIVRPVGAASVTAVMVDEDRLLNVNALVGPDGKQDAVLVRTFERLIDDLGFDGPEMTSRIIDFIDADEDDQDLKEAKNAPLRVADELRQVYGLPKELLEGYREKEEWIPGLLEFVSVWSPLRQVNVNTAGKRVLEALSDNMTPEAAEAILKYRETTDPEKEHDYQVFHQGALTGQLADAFMNYGGRMSSDQASALAAEITPRFTTLGLVFSVKLLATHGTEVQKARAVLYRSGSSGFDLLYWKIEGDTFTPEDLDEATGGSQSTQTRIKKKK
ncbi:MAG: type II secretion system minor pseudopilin GspK [Planctomycetes bacterium]|nr:type II secretion system minor pseudopilin GspK [Planctomycetota bacterium]